jgi:RNA polymerase sigma factor (TIGR02999 family)
MRHILVDYARQRQASLRREREGLFPEEVAAVDAEVVEVLAVEDALTRLADLDDRLARVVECRFFGGLASAETAEALGVSRRTVDRDWTRARTHLHRILRSERRGGI